jgi:hypothetical protein
MPMIRVFVFVVHWVLAVAKSEKVENFVEVQELFLRGGLRSASLVEG